MFRKLDIDLREIDLSLIKGQANNSYGSTFIEHPVKNLDHVLEILKTKVKFKIRPSRVNVTDILSPGADPHIDHWPVALNYYFTAGNDITKFYKHSSVHAHREIGLFDKNKLELQATFVANQGDCILLNTHVPHSVSMAESSPPRTILRFIWFDRTYDEILESIQIL